MQSIKVVGVPDFPHLLFNACENMQAIKLLLLEEIPELFSDNCSSECSSLQDMRGHCHLFHSQKSDLSRLDLERDTQTIAM